MSDHQFLHPILPCEFLDSPEFESSRANMDEKFKVKKKFHNAEKKRKTKEWTIAYALEKKETKRIF